MAAGGAGGSINITANSISGGGTLSVAGGNGENVSGGGGGGRIAIITAGSGFGGLRFSAAAGLGWNGAAGTIYLKKSGDINGVLLVNGGGVVPSAPATTIFTSATYQFDTITITNQGVFVVGTNATLDLTGCTLTSDSTTNSITSRLIIATAGSTVIWPAVWTNNGTISWAGTNGVTVAMNLTVASGGILTHEVGPTHAINLDLDGDLTVDTGGAIWVKGIGYGGASGPAGYVGAARNGGSHGGQGGLSGAGGDPGPNYPGMTYGSVTNPVTPGGGAFYGPVCSGGGVVIFRATGTVTVDGIIDAGSVDSDSSTGAGGSVNIRAGELLGNGSISVKSGNHNSDRASGGGGRIAVVLTDAATFGSVTMTAAAGTCGGDRCGASGTIYLKGTNAAYGRLIIPGSTYQSTLISPYVTDAVVGEVQLLGTAKFVISSNCTLTAYGSWSNAAGASAISGAGTVELAGSGAATVWGDNNWYNLTIASAGKVVSFETNKLQLVTGAATFDNGVTLLSTVPGVQWKIRVPGTPVIETQPVGRVNARDSDADQVTGKTFVAAHGLDLGNNINWIFPPAGTVLTFW